MAAPGAVRRISCTRRTRSARDRARSTPHQRFERWKERTTSSGSRSPRLSRMSLRTSGVALAVSASVGLSVKRFTLPIARYAGRKSCPHSLMQWASSTASRATWTLSARAMSPGVARRSGETKRRSSPPERPRAITPLRSDADCVAAREAARSPTARARAT